MSTFETESIRLSLRNAETGRPLTASVYRVTFDDGSSRVMSMSELVMALCLARATEKEDAVVALMQTMALTTERIEVLTSIEQAILDENASSVTLADISGSWTITDPETGDGKTYETADEALKALGFTFSSPVATATAVDQIEAELDQCNTMSQSQMISLQSETNKRDQSYEMISNIIKSLYTVMTGVVNNV